MQKVWRWLKQKKKLESKVYKKMVIKILFLFNKLWYQNWVYNNRMWIKDSNIELPIKILIIGAGFSIQISENIFG